MLARKVALKPTPYEEGECFDEKVTLIFYKRVWVVLVVSLLRLYVFCYSRFVLLHWIHSKFFHLLVCLCSVYVVFDVLYCSTGTIFLRLFFHSFEPYSYPYPVILTLKIHQSVALKVAQLFPVSNLFPSGLWLKLYPTSPIYI